MEVASVTARMPLIFSVWLLLHSGHMLSQGASTRTQTAVAGLSTNIHILCDLGQQEDAPFWFINNTIYQLLSIPKQFPFIPVVDSFAQLIIPIVTLDLNDTLFQCALIEDEELVYGIITRLLVLPNLISSNGSTVKDNIILLMNYQDFAVEQNMTTIGWNFVNGRGCSEVFVLEGYTLPSLMSDLPSPAISYTIHAANTAQIPSDELMTSTGEPILYRIVAVDESWTICSDRRSINTFYRFDISEVLDTRVLAPNSEVCYDIPDSHSCTVHFGWPRMSGQESGGYCYCPVANNSLAHLLFNQCDCIQSNLSHIVPHLSPTGNGSICLRDRNRLLNDTVTLFQCITNLCGLRDCFVWTILAIHKIIIAGPPSAPIITYNSSNESICISAYSHAEFPIRNFTVKVTDITRIVSPLSDIYNTTGPLYLSLTSDFVPSICFPLQVSILVWNNLGNSQKVMTFEKDEEFLKSCACYKKREQMYVFITNITDDSATINLSCAVNQTGLTNYLLQSTSQSHLIQLYCGSNSIDSLIPNTDYIISRQYNNYVTCEISVNFTTQGMYTTVTPNRTTPLITLTIIIITIMTVLFNLCIIILLYMLIMCKRSSKSYRVKDHKVMYFYN